MQFLQFFVWGSWLLTIGAYWFQTKHWSGTEFGAIFSTMGIASLFMPALAGIIADRIINAEKLYAFFHLMGALVLFYVPQINDPNTMFWVMLLNMIFYMPTISLSISVSYSAMKKANMDIIKDYPPIRIWGTIGFIAALWTTSLVVLKLLRVNFMWHRASLWGSPSMRSPCLNAPHWAKIFQVPCMKSLGSMLLASLKIQTWHSSLCLPCFWAPLYNSPMPTVILFYMISHRLNNLKTLLRLLIQQLFYLFHNFRNRYLFSLFLSSCAHFGIKQVMFISMIAWTLRFGLPGFSGTRRRSMDAYLVLHYLWHGF